MNRNAKTIILLVLSLSLLLLAACTKRTGTTPSVSQNPTNSLVSPTEIEEGCAHKHTKKVSSVSPTCTTEGYTDRLKCTDCGAVLDTTGRILPAYGHVYEGRKCKYCDKNEPSLIIEGNFAGSAVKWQIFDDGELAISGVGAIPDMPDNENSFFYKYNKHITSIVIYDGVTEIGNNVFRNLKDVTVISVASSVVKIGDHSFDGWSLKTLNLSMRVKSIGKSNFTGNQIFFVELPGSLEHVGAGSFTSAQTVTLRIPSSVKEYEVLDPGQYSNINNIAFMGTKSQFDRLALAKHLRSDGDCSAVNILYEYTDKASSLPYCTKRNQKSGDFTYCIYTDNTARITAYKGTDSEIVIPEKVGSYKVVAIDHNCFEENTTVKKVTLPESCTKIYAEAFLKSGLEELVIQGNTMTLAAAAFEDAKSFATLTFDGVFLDVGARAFANTKVENIPLSPSMTVARVSSFAHSSIKNVDFSQFEIIADSAFGYTNITDTLNLSGVKEIGRGAFYRAGIKYVDVTGVGSIAQGAFSSNSSLTLYSVNGLDTVKTIEDGAFDFKIS